MVSVDVKRHDYVLLHPLTENSIRLKSGGSAGEKRAALNTCHREALNRLHVDNDGALH